MVVTKMTMKTINSDIVCVNGASLGVLIETMKEGPNARTSLVLLTTKNYVVCKRQSQFLVLMYQS